MGSPRLPLCSWRISQRLLSTRKERSSSSSVDITVVGGGIVGLATAQELIYRYPELTFALVEKEGQGLGLHQTGNNSGVIHAGIYYKPGSLMAKLCVEGLYSTYKYCDKHNIPYKKCGKLLVATNLLDVKNLEALFRSAEQNECPDVRMVDGSAIKEFEPACVGARALVSPHTGIVDYGQVAKQYGVEFQRRGGRIELGFHVTKFEATGDPNFPVRIVGSKPGQKIECSYVLTCAGLHSDRVAQMTGCDAEPKIVPFRGEYLLLSEEKAKLIRGNIYPVPDPRFPFLGVHFTPRMNGEVWLGPNAVPALRREGYSWSQVNVGDTAEILTYPGFHRVATKYAGFGISQILKSFIIELSVKELRKYVPSIRSSDVTWGPAGVRATAMNRQGEFVGDFVFDSPPKGKELSKRVLHCRNAPSPGATASLAIARMMADKVSTQFGLPKREKAVLY